MTKDEEFLRDLFHASYRRLVGQLFVVCGDLATAEDVVQEAFVRAVDHSRTLSRADNPEAWLYRVALNLQRSRWRRMRAFARLQPKLAEPAPDPEISADHLLVLQALGRLPGPQREAIVLHHLADQPVGEVAAALGVPVGTVKTRLARGRKALAELLSEEGETRHV